MKTPDPITLRRIMADPMLAQFANDRQDGRSDRVPRCETMIDDMTRGYYRLALNVLTAADGGLAEAFPQSVAPVTLDADDIDDGDLLLTWCDVARDERRAQVAGVLRAVADSIDPDADHRRGELHRRRYGSPLRSGAAVPMMPSLPELGVRLAGLLADQFAAEIEATPDTETN